MKYDPAILSELSPVLEKEILVHLTAMNKAAADLKGKAGGNTKGGHWTTEMPADGDILKWFEQTLDNIDANEIEKRLQKVQQARCPVVSWREGPPFERYLERLHFTFGTLGWNPAFCDCIACRIV